jgi:uncharacterized caspase-like protein
MCRSGCRGERVALVIGNSAYEHADGLTNPVIDARSVRAALTKISFDDANIVYGENLTKRDFERAIARFATSARDSDVAVIFYAGHGSTFAGIRTPCLSMRNSRTLKACLTSW